MNSGEETIEKLKSFFHQYRELYGEWLISGKDQKTNETDDPVVQDFSEVQEPEMDYILNKSMPTLQELESMVAGCTRCALSKTRTKTVFGAGNPKANLMFIGEAPGADEDAQGLPFVGRAGQLLTKMIEEPRSLDIPRSMVYIANILKCRPPGNRNPNQEEIACCEPYLIAQIERIRPKIICALGKVAANTLLRNDLPMNVLRGQVYDYHSIPLVVTYHPAALLRNPNWKIYAWEDMLKLKSMLLSFSGTEKSSDDIR